MDYYKTKREKLERLRVQLISERQSFISHWRVLGDYIQPRRPRFSTKDNNKGDRRNYKIIDNTGTLAARTQRSGMMGGITSPARPWFRLTTSDAAKNDIQSVKLWLHNVSELMTTVFLKSNLYNALPVVYGDMGTFATAALYCEKDDHDVLRFYPFPIGTYCIANNHKLQVNVFLREYQMTVRQVVETFGWNEATRTIDWSNISDAVKQLWDRDAREDWVEIVHVIQPNDLWDPEKAKLQAKFKRFSSDYYERSAGSGSQDTQGNERFLRQSGYDLFPVLCPRWEVSGQDAYGTDCPGMSAVNDIKALQIAHTELATAIAKMANPPVTGPTALKNSQIATIPGGITYDDTPGASRGFRPTYEVNPRVQELMVLIQDIQGRIRRAYYEDLFLMLSTSTRGEMTATEVDERKEEKLLALGPVLEQLNQDMLDPLIDITFAAMVEDGLIPDAPPELQGVELKVEYVSIMAQAQKMIGISSVERYINFVFGMAKGDPTVMDKLDLDQTADVYGDMTSVPPSIIRSDDDVAKLRQSRAAAQQKQAQIQAGLQTSQTIKNLAQAPVGDDSNALEAMGAAAAGGRGPGQ